MKPSTGQAVGRGARGTKISAWSYLTPQRKWRNAILPLGTSEAITDCLRPKGVRPTAGH